MKEIKLTKLKSSMIQSSGYCPETKTMAVEFNGGRTYLFPGVDPEHYKAFRESESPGRHFHNNIRGKYDSIKVEEKK